MPLYRVRFYLPDGHVPMTWTGKATDYWHAIARCVRRHGRRLDVRSVNVVEDLDVPDKTRRPYGRQK